MKKFLGQAVTFVKTLSTDPDIPKRDKMVLAGMAVLLLSPVDLIPDFIPILGQLDDVFILLVVLDYVFNIVPEEVMLRHYPWDPKKLIKLRSRIGLFSKWIPEWVHSKVWQRTKQESI